MPYITDLTGHVKEQNVDTIAWNEIEKDEHIYIICIDTATEVCSVALARDSEVLAYRENGDGKSHARTLLPFVDEVLAEAGLRPQQLGAVAISMGPGSYTGLRIGTSTAKGLCYALGTPLIALPTLQIIAAGAREEAAENTLLCPMIDARRMEVFTALYDKDLRPLQEVSAQVIDEHSFSETLATNKVLFCGNGAEKCKPLLSQNPNAQFLSKGISAKDMAALALARFQNRQFEDIAYFEPFYLKEYVAAKPHVKGL